MIESVLLSLALTAAVVRGAERLTASIFSLLTLTFYFINEIIPDDVYYIASALYDIFIMLVMSLIYFSTFQRLAKILSLIGFVSVIIQMIGMRIYMTGGSGEIYDNAGILFYIAIIALFLWRGLSRGERNNYSGVFADNFRSAKNSHKGA